MNDFEGLLPTRAAPPALPDRGGPVAVVRAARLRRRRRASRVGAGSAASLAVAGLLLLPGHGTQSLQPVNPPTATPSPGATAPAPDQGGTGATTSPGAPGSTSGGGSGNSSGSPTADPRGSGSPTSPTADPSGGPYVMTASRGPDQGPFTYNDVDRTEIADPNDGPCEVWLTDDSPPARLCARYRGPMTAKYATATDLTYDLCAAADTVLRFQFTQEMLVELQGASGGWISHERDTRGAHEETLRAGRCFRYVVHWSARYASGRPMETGPYRILAAPRIAATGTLETANTLTIMA
jgi:hypothetical protein